MLDSYWTDRGFPWEHDPGPPANRTWARLFAETPNYRGIGKAAIGHEAFRWHFGPMFYRGRLGDGQVRVLVVGQEGAQDESLAHRSFSGGTGARMQHLLRHLGITRSYLFLNTFVYPIFGQYGAELRVLAQHVASPIRIHRERIFDYLVARNDVHLAIGVGTAAKESLASWVASHGGNANPAKLHEADATVISPRLQMLGVLHPGGASAGGATAIIADFKAAARRVARWRTDDAGWLPADADGQIQPPDDYRYRSAPIPFRDLPYGLPWRIGRGGTSSNRRDGQAAIQLFSADGAYNNSGHSLSYTGSVAGTRTGYVDEPGDLPYEPPRARFAEFDRGPGTPFARLLQGGESGFGWPDFATLGLRAHPSLGHGPVYRGRLDRPGILVLADQASHDDLFTGRAATGDDGQHLQAFLRAAGLTARYAILRVLPIDTLGETAARVRAAVDSSATGALYAEAIRRSDPDVVLAVGPSARGLVAHHAPLGGRPLVEMAAYGATGWKPSWQQALVRLGTLTYARDVAQPAFSYEGEREQIPRIDLPYGTLRWQGSSGDRGQRARRGSNPSFDYYKLAMPAWTVALDPRPLTAGEQQTIDGLV